MHQRLDLIITLIAFACVMPISVVMAAPPPLAVSTNGRHLIQNNGKPFFWLGDTAWELTHKLDRNQIDQYLDDRKARGFNVIQTVGLAELDGLTVPNVYGQLPLNNLDPHQPNDAYFQHVDYAIDQAAARGMYVAFLPTWGDKVVPAWGTDPPIFDPDYQNQGHQQARAKAAAYGRFIGQRYANRDNVMFIMGGDRAPHFDSDVWRAMAEAIHNASNGQLMSFHPLKGWSSSYAYHNDDWLDFNMFQSGQSETEKSYQDIAADYAKTPVKPTLDAEPRYEGLGNVPVWVRRKAYWGTFAGGFGHTYGHFSLWKIQRQGDPNPRNEPTWDQALSAEGGDDMRHLRALMESRPILDRIPDQNLIKSNEGEFEDRLQATRDQAGSYAMIYSSNGRAFDVDMTRLASDQNEAVGWWYNPRNGDAQQIAQILSTEGIFTFTPPTSGDDQDWVLVLDAKGAGYPMPGGAYQQPLDPRIPEPATGMILGVCALGLLARRNRLAASRARERAVGRALVG